MPVDPVRDFGHMLDIDTIKRGLVELNPEINFDPAGRLGIDQPRLDVFQGVYYGTRHLATLDRGPAVPEFDIWGCKNGKPALIVRRGWRETFDRIVRKRIPGLNWDTLCRKFRVDYKIKRDVVDGNPETVEVA